MTTEAVHVSSAEVQMALKLEEIFMPEARRQRTKHYSDKNSDPRFVLYTIAGAALSII